MRKVLDYYANSKSIAIKEGLINYLKNKQKHLSKYGKPENENSLLADLKKITHSDHWSDLALCLPIYAKERAKKSKVSNIFEFGVNPIYYLNLSKDNLLGFSLSTVTDDDMFDMMNSIRKALNSTKPEGVDSIDLSQPKSPNDIDDTIWENPKIYLSGKIVDQKMVIKFSSLLEKMIIEFNSPHVDKNKNRNGDYEIREKNKAYLRKMAEIYWLDLELDDSETKKKKVSKV